MISGHLSECGVPGVGSPPRAERLNGTGIEIIDCRPRKDLRREVGPRLIEDAPEQVRRHGHKVLAATLPVCTVNLHGRADGAGWNMKDEHAAIGMPNPVSVNPKPKPLNQAGLRPLQVVECLTANDATRAFVRNAKNHSAAALIRDGRAILQEFVKVEATLGFLELQVLVLPGVHPLPKLVQRHAHHASRSWHSLQLAAPMPSSLPFRTCSRKGADSANHNSFRPHDIHDRFVILAQQ